MKRISRAPISTTPVSSPITPDDRLLSATEVSELIGKSKAWLARKRWEGDGIPYRKIGHNVRYQRSVVMKWLNDQPEMVSTSSSARCN